MILLEILKLHWNAVSWVELFSCEEFYFNLFNLDSFCDHGILYMKLIHQQGFPRWYSAKLSAYQCRRCKRWRFGPWVRKTLRSRKWQPNPVFLPGKLHGQKSLAAYRHRVTKSQTQLSNWAHTVYGWIAWKIIFLNLSNDLIDSHLFVPAWWKELFTLTLSSAFQREILMYLLVRSDV